MKNQKISKYIFDSKNIDLNVFNNSFFNTSIQKRCTETNCISENEYLSLLEHDENEVTILLESLFISYSEFFRNPLTFSVLQRIILPSLKLTKINENKKEIRIWSSACASGQEIYSLAIMLNELMTTNDDGVNFRIFATDYDQRQIDIAKKGHYSVSELNNVSMKRLKDWFDEVGTQFMVKQVLKENIYFSTFDLLNKDFSSPPSSIFGGFDIVFCANLLFYYKPEIQKQILAKMANSLAKDGLIITGEIEREILIQHNFIELYPYSGIFRTKNKNC